MTRWVAAGAAGLALVLGALALRPEGEAARQSQPPPSTSPTATPTATPTPSPSPGPPAPAGVHAIRSAHVAPHLRELAAIARRSGGNRAAGTDGYDASAAYVARVLREAGWRVRMQRARFPFFEQRRPPVLEIVGGRRLRRGRDLRTMTYSGSGSVTGRPRGIGLAPGRPSAAGCAPGDFAPLRRGEIAVVQRGTCTLREKAQHAQRAGADAVLIPNDGVSGRIEAIRGTLGAPGIRVPVLALSTAAGTRVARARRVRVSVATTSRRRTTTSVLADAGSGRRVVMAGAHLDSVTESPGINDNASGVSALLAIAQAVRGQAPGRGRLRLAFWGAEELGLYGSRRYVRRLSARERRAIRAYVNLDMVGSPGRAPAVYTGDPQIARALRIGLRRRDDRSVGSRPVGAASDHAPFAAAGIPVGGIFTGLDRCYHRRCDDLDNVDRRLIADVAAATGRALLRLARSG